VTAIDYLGGRVSPHIGLRLLSSGMTADATQTFLVGEVPPKVLQISPAAFPDVVRQAAEKSQLAQAALGSALGWAVVTPIETWDIDGVSCALFEQLTPMAAKGLRRRFQIRRMTPAVLGWLRGVAALDRGANRDAYKCLSALANCPYESLRAAADESLDRLNHGAFSPRSRVMHTDFWIGNLLLDPGGDLDFRVIDWRGSKVDGFPIFDLIRFAESVKLSPKKLRRELEAHSQQLGCELGDLRSYLLAALGSVWLNLDQFPPERFASLAERVLRTLEQALKS